MKTASSVSASLSPIWRFAPATCLLGETIAGSAFEMGPGGKGSNQAVAAARAGADVIFCSRIGAMRSAKLPSDVGRGRHSAARRQDCGGADRRRTIYVDETRGGNAIIVAAERPMVSPHDVDAAADDRASRVFVTQLEQPVAAAQRGLEIARAAGSSRSSIPRPRALRR